MGANRTRSGGTRANIFGMAAVCVAVLSILGPVFGALDEGKFHAPEQEYGVRCWWWWLNGNVTKSAITRDLEAMKSKGFSGAMIFDAGGADQRGNQQVPAGPTYGTPEWRELYMHALREGKRLGLELGLSIQSGWNLGGPNVTPDFAAKQLVWSETQLEGPGNVQAKLPEPSARAGYYRDICVLAYPEKERGDDIPLFEIEASSSQSEFPPENALGGDSFWVSGSKDPGKGPTPDSPEWLEFTFRKTVTVSGLFIQGRPQYGPASLSLSSVDQGESSEVYNLDDGAGRTLRFQPMAGSTFRVVFQSAYDPRYPDSPRNVQVMDLALMDEEGKLYRVPGAVRPIQNLTLKSAFRELGGSAPDCRFLLDSLPPQEGEEQARVAQIRDISAFMSDDGELSWSVPEGEWTILRFGYTITGAHVSTYSAGWSGLVIDYLSKNAFDRYWREVVEPLLDAAGPLAGSTLKQLETDSWECGGMNWSPGFREEFMARRGYDPIPYLPVFAGKIIEGREQSNAFLADFRKTLGDCVAENHYQLFAEYAHRYGLEIQPESGGPHAGPMDAIKNYGKSDIVMSEFWVPSPHRPTPEARFFVKQASSAAHIYGKKIVGAESFTSIGPHWEDVLWRAQKPSLDHELCSGLNMVFFHTFTCSPEEMGIPGQEYFAGTHVNPQVTWWDHSDAFIDYIGRCQYLAQQGEFVGDVLYYYGDHVPVLARLKEDDPAGALPGFDYDVTNEEILLRLEVDRDRIVVPGGVRYRVLVLPDHRVLSLAALEKVEKLLKAGATVIGPKPERLVSLSGGEQDQIRFHALSDKIWGDDIAAPGSREVGRGRLFWGRTASDVLLDDGVMPDVRIDGCSSNGRFDWIHYRIDGADVYFLSNQTERDEEVECAFRVSGRLPELWDPLTGKIRILRAFAQKQGATTIPMRFGPNASFFVVFREPCNDSRPGDVADNFPQKAPVAEVTGPWEVAFDPTWGGPASVKFEKLMDWSTHPDPGIRDYSGAATYSTVFEWAGDADAAELWLDLGAVEDTGIASVRLNGRDLGILWTRPFEVEMTSALRKGENQLEIRVVNSWRNRLVGDRELPVEKRLTRTNITLQQSWKRVASGLLGPVRIEAVFPED